MILLVDVGNSNICFATAKDNKIISNFRIKTNLHRSYDEYYLLISSFIKDELVDVIISSVVPVVTSSLVKVFKKYYKINSKVIVNKLTSCS